MLTLESQHRRAIERSRVSPLAFVAKRWGGDRVDWQAINSGETSGVVHVRANHGMWQTDCPVLGCGGSVLASETDLRFVCPACGFGPAAVVWPKNRPAIEAALAVRPVPNQNWEPGESIAFLRDENKRNT